MSRSLFGWSLPPGVSTLPGDEPDPLQPCDEAWPRCGCGGLLKFEPEEPPPGAPQWEACGRHGHDRSQCETVHEAADSVRYDEPLTPEQHAVLDAAQGCVGPMYAVYEYRTCRKCGAVTRTAVW